MQALFVRHRTITSALIRWVTWSPWSHVAIVEDAEHVIDARLVGGVQRRSLQALLAGATAHEFIDVPVPDEAGALRWAREQIGRPYDPGALWGMVWRSSRWADGGRWFCSELFEAALIAGGLVRFRLDAARITPGHAWMVR